MNVFVSLRSMKKMCYNNIVECSDQRISKNPTPDLNSKTNRYTFKTPSRGISTINSRSARLYLKINIQV